MCQIFPNILLLYIFDGIGSTFISLAIFMAFQRLFVLPGLRERDKEIKRNLVYQESLFNNDCSNVRIAFNLLDLQFD